MTKPKRSAKQAVLRRDGGKCVLAGPRCTEVATTVDHWIPQCLGGTHVQENLRASCDNCNQDKGDMSPDEWWTFVMVEKRTQWDVTDDPSPATHRLSIPTVSEEES